MKAVALFSGGLDSLLAIKIVQTQGIEVIPVTFTSYFFDDKKARKNAELNNLELITISLINILRLFLIQNMDMERG